MTPVVLALLFSSLIAQLIMALAPPSPYFTDFENVHAHRRRLNITFSYQTKHISAEHCRYMNETECELLDRRHGNLQVHRHRHLGELPEEPGSGLERNPRVGNIRIPVILIRFPEDRDKNLSSIEWIETVLNGKGVSVENPVGSISQWLYYQSLGKYKATFEVLADWDEAPQSMAYYSEGRSGLVGPERLQDVFNWKLDLLDEQEIDWRRFDSDNNMALDQLLVLHSGYAAEQGGPRDCLNNYNNRIWSQGSSYLLENTWTSKQQTLYGMALAGYGITSAVGVKGLCDDPYLDMGMTSHEMLHGVGMIDTYDSDADEPEVNIGGVATYDIMASAYGWNRDPRYPGYASPYNKMIAGWLEPTEITRNGFYAVQPSEISNNVYIINAGFPDGEFLMIENRAAMRWNEDAPEGCRGILVWHIDENQPLQSERSWPGRNDWPKAHYKVSVLQADGNYDLEKATNLGDAGDFWAAGMVLGPTDTWPNTHSYQNGVITPTGIKISFLTEKAYVMLFKVEDLPGGGSFAPELVPIDPVKMLETNTSNTNAIMENGGESNASFTDVGEDPSTVGKRVAWILSMLGGTAVMLGILMFLL